MNNDTPLSGQRPVSQRDGDLSRKLDSIGWALFFIWIGIALLADVGWGWGLIGVATIILAETAIRWFRKLNVGGFWIAVGLMFLAGGFWELFRVPWPLAPFLIIGCGIAVLLGVWRGRHMTEK